MNDSLPLPYMAPNPFNQTAQKLQVLRDKLNYNTYTALFGRTVEERQRAASEATSLTKQIEAVLGEAFTVAGEVAKFANSPLSDGGLYRALDNFLAFIENPTPLQAQSPPCTAMQSAPGIG